VRPCRSRNSPESLECLAAAFELDFAILAAGDTMDDKQEQEAFRYVRRLRGFYAHTAINRLGRSL